MDAIVENQPSLASQVAARIRMLRKQRGMNIEALAKAIGTSPQSVSRLETEQQMLSMYWLQRICVALQIQPYELFAGNALTEAIDARMAAEARLHVLRSGLERFCDTVKATYSEELGR
jgi:transcriptional regulator with XRE-family HTH domain